jgi:hypothetical protein
MRRHHVELSARPRNEDKLMAQASDQVGTRLLFENERVRVWDLALAPGESLGKHAHRLDYMIIVESGGLIRFDDPDDPAAERVVQYEDDQVLFREVNDAKIDNRLTNIGIKRHRNFVIELKRGSGPADSRTSTGTHSITSP